MNVLVVGNGAREHAITWKLSQSPSVRRLFVAPGNAGTHAIASNVPINAADIPALIRFRFKERNRSHRRGPRGATRHWYR